MKKIFLIIFLTNFTFCGIIDILVETKDSVINNAIKLLNFIFLTILFGICLTN